MNRSKISLEVFRSENFGSSQSTISGPFSDVYCCVAWLIFFATFLSSLGKVLSRPSRVLYASLHGKRVMQHSNVYHKLKRETIRARKARDGAIHSMESTGMA
jgi:hypothetical protein